MKNCLVYETLNQVSELKIEESKIPNTVRLSGIFGVCGIKNGNNRIYEKANYGKMVEALQNIIATQGCPGELEHPNSMNINLENVSHKIESIQMNEDGTVTGTILLLNTPKGKIALALVEGDLPLFISSRGAGSIDESGHVTLSSIKTYDLVGTPGFSQAKLNLSENQTFERLNENLCIVTESEHEHDDDDDKKDDKKDDHDDDSTKDDNKNNKDEKTSKEDNMNEIKETIESLKQEIEDLKAQMHVAQESINGVNSEVNSIKENKVEVNYDAIQQWISEEFAKNYTETILENIQNWVRDDFAEEFESQLSDNLKSWVCEEFAPEVQNWICEEFAPEVQNWICEEFAPEVQNWVCEEFAPEVQNWICEEFAPEVQNWVCEEFAPVVDNWICEEFGTSVKDEVLESAKEWCKGDFAKEVYENINEYMESKSDDVFNSVDAMLEAIEGKSNAAEAAKVIEEGIKDRWESNPIVAGMPSNMKPLWNMCSESKKEDICNRAKLYNFSKPGVMESFWNSVDFTEVKQQPVVETKNYSNYQMSVIESMKKLNNKF